MSLEDLNTRLSECPTSFQQNFRHNFKVFSELKDGRSSSDPPFQSVPGMCNGKINGNLVCPLSKANFV